MQSDAFPQLGAGGGEGSRRMGENQTLGQESVQSAQHNKFQSYNTSGPGGGAQSGW